MMNISDKVNIIAHALVILILVSILFIGNVLIIDNKHNIYITIVCSIVAILIFIISNTYIIRMIYLTYLGNNSDYDKYCIMMWLIIILILIMLYTTFMLMAFI